jgi:hypothetical protein
MKIPKKKTVERFKVALLGGRLARVGELHRIRALPILTGISAAM